MASTYKTPGVYLEEISKLPPSVAQVETAIPAFLGYTKSQDQYGVASALHMKPMRITSMNDYVNLYGGAPTTTFTVAVTVDSNATSGYKVIATPPATQPFRLYHSLEMYFANGGGPCYIVSVGTYSTVPAELDFTTGLANIAKVDEPTMLIIADSMKLLESAAYNVYKTALTQAGTLMDRVVLVDVFMTDTTTDWINAASHFRDSIGTSYLSYGASYYPFLKSSLNYTIDEATHDITVPGGGVTTGGTYKLKLDATPANSVFHLNNALYSAVKEAMNLHFISMPPSCAVAGVYCSVDNARGVWKAPANVSLNFVKEPLITINDEGQKDLNVSVTGKSVNAIRKFTGKGIMVWGARTLAGNDNEWRYISVRRFFNMVEESVKKASEPFVFEPNDANTWVKVKAMIENFLILQWRSGALQGAKPNEAFYVNVGLGSTMSSLDVLEGRMIVEIGMAVVRPAEFIILKFMHKMQE